MLELENYKLNRTNTIIALGSLLVLTIGTFFVKSYEQPSNQTSPHSQVTIMKGLLTESAESFLERKEVEVQEAKGLLPSCYDLSELHDEYLHVLHSLIQDTENWTIHCNKSFSTSYNLRIIDKMKLLNPYPQRLDTVIDCIQAKKGTIFTSDAIWPLRQITLNLAHQKCK